MPSNSTKGALAKARTKKWLIEKGYDVADLEKVHWIFTAKGRIPTKKDQFGCDLLAMNESGVVFIQVKSGKAAIGGTFPAARREFDKFKFPTVGNVPKKVVIAWAPRARAPRIVEC